MGLFDKRKKKNDEEAVSDIEQSAAEQSAENSGEARPSLLERLGGGAPIFTDHESDIEYNEEYEAQQRESSFFKLK